MPESTARIAEVIGFVNRHNYPGTIRYETVTAEPREIADTNTPSEHNWGNAVDIFASNEVMLDIAKKLNGVRSDLEIEVLCYDGPGSPGYDRCTTKHINHVHVDASPHCGGKISAQGSASERVRRCQEYQGNPDAFYTGAVEAVGDIVPDIGAIAGRVLLGVAGVVAIAAAVAIVLNDLKGDALKGLVGKAVKL